MTRVFLMGFMVLVCGGALATMAAVGWVVATADSAPNIDQLRSRVSGQVSEVYAANGSLLGYLTSSVLRTVVPAAQMPTKLREATVAIEDRRFYQHGGVDYQGILRAGIKDLLSGSSDVQGGSTLTMQLVNNVYLPDRIKEHHNIKYKIIQAKLANQLEAKESKNWILTHYLNDVDYGTVDGQSAIGVGAASHMFFDKPVTRLDLAQIALLAGLPQAPSEYNPFLRPELARQRRSEVLFAMARSHYISEARAETANDSRLQVKPNETYQQVRQPYVFDYVKRQLVKDLGQQLVDQGGLKIYTTINLHDQALARTAILAHEGEPGDPASALVSMNPHNGHILAMAQSTTYKETNFNYATDSQRQTGSSFKPFVMMTLIHDDDGDPQTTFYDSHLLAAGWLPGYPTYSVHTSELTYQGVISVAHAMTVSDNTVFAQLGVDLGMDKVDAIAHQMGITAPLFGYPSEAIGGLHIGVSPLQMADAYGTMANGGLHYTPTIISKVVFPDASVRDLGDVKPRRVFTYGETYAADQVLKTVITSGTGTAANYGCPAAGKTGTTSNYTDAWFVGYTPQLSTAVWTGYPNDTASMTDVNGLGPGFGGTLSAPIWHDYMESASDGYCGDWTIPTDPWHGTSYIGKYTAVPTATTTTTTKTTTTVTTTTTPNSSTSTTVSVPPGTATSQTPPTPTPTPTPTTTAPAGTGSGHTRTNGGAGVKK